MAAAAKPGGTMVIGDMTLKHRRSVNTRQHLPHDAIEAIGVIERHGAEVSATISASDADFERYVSHHRHATLDWAREHPDHPDSDEVLDKSRDDWMYYLQTIRPLLGWTIFVGRRAGGYSAAAGGFAYSSPTPNSLPFSATRMQIRTNGPSPRSRARSASACR